jgi:hypothetical protein
MSDRTRRQRRKRYDDLQKRGECVLRVTVNRANLEDAIAATGLLRRHELDDRALIAQRVGYVVRLWVRSVIGTRSGAA